MIEVVEERNTIEVDGEVKTVVIEKEIVGVTSVAEQGPSGPAGPGLPAGGVDRQFLTKGPGGGRLCDGLARIST